jgi:type VII secretion-associated serine protease mycosin
MSFHNAGYRTSFLARLTTLAAATIALAGLAVGQAYAAESATPGHLTGSATGSATSSSTSSSTTTAPPPTTTTTVGPPPTTAPAPAPTPRLFSLVREPDGQLVVDRGTATTVPTVDAVHEPGSQVLAVERDVPVKTMETAGENDPMRPQQWALDQTSFERAWFATRGSGVKVAIIDSGIDAAHQDLGSVVLPGIDYIDRGRDGRYDPRGHGTHVAGIVAARVNNGVGIAGAAPNVRLLPVRVIDSNGSGVTSNLVAGIIWATDHGARVINLSLGGGPSAALQIALRYAASKGVVVVAAAGNNGTSGNAPVYPAAYPEAIAVGAFDRNLHRAAFSNIANYVDVSAPGDYILSTWSSSPSSYAIASGTSMAAPYAAAEAALIIAENPRLSAAAVKLIMEGTTRDAGAAGFDPQFGYGLINPGAAVLAATPRPPGYGTKGHGYWVVGPSGGVHAFGAAHNYGWINTGGSPIVASARTATGRGYWLVSARGAVFSFGDAHYYGGMNQRPLNAPIVGMAATPTGAGYILLAADGGVFTFGHARFYGSTGGMRLNARVLDLAMTRSGRGYWFVAADGGVFSFGDARFHGSTGAMRLAAPVTSMASSSDGRGYWLVASDGGIFAFNVPFEGSIPWIRELLGGMTAPTVRMRAVSSNDGYYLLGLDGSVAAFGTARFFGSAVPNGSIDVMLAR